MQASPNCTRYEGLTLSVLPCVFCSPQAGRRAAEVVSSAFPAPMEMKFEKVCQPLLLLHVNR